MAVVNDATAAVYTLSVIRRSQKRNLTLLCVVCRENNSKASSLAHTSAMLQPKGHGTAFIVILNFRQNKTAE